MRYPNLTLSLICCLMVGCMGSRASKPILIGVSEDVSRSAFEYRDESWHPLDAKQPRAPMTWMVSFDKATAQPPLLISTPRASDPEHWTVTTLSNAELRLAIASFRERVPSMHQCDRPEEQPIHLVPYADGEISVLHAYRSSRGEVLLGERLDQSRDSCGFFDDEVFFDYWFVLKGTTVRFLDTQMAPIGAADFIASGRSEWLFRTSRKEDDHGYELFYNNFSNKVATVWHYH